MTWQSIPLRAATLIDRPSADIRHTLHRVDVWQRTAAVLGFRLEVTGGGDIWTTGTDRIRVQPIDRRFGRRHHAVRVDGDLPGFRIVGGPARGAQLRLLLADTGAGALLTADFGNPHRGAGPVARLRGMLQSRHRTRILWALRTLLGIVLLEQHQTRLVVAAAMIREGAVLAARRSYPPEIAGRWEFPGGKVGVGEEPEAALKREIAEEFGVVIVVGPTIGAEVSLEVETVLRLYRVDVVDGELQPHEHDELRWLAAHEIDELDWLPADQVLLPAVARVLGDPPLT